MYVQTLSCGSSESHSWKLCGCVMSFSFFFSMCIFQFGIYENWCQISLVCHSPTSVWQRPCQSEEICDRQAGLYFKMSPNSVTFPTDIIRLMWESQCSSVFQFCRFKMRQCLTSLTIRICLHCLHFSSLLTTSFLQFAFLSVRVLYTRWYCGAVVGTVAS